MRKWMIALMLAGMALGGVSVVTSYYVDLEVVSDTAQTITAWVD